MEGNHALWPDGSATDAETERSAFERFYRANVDEVHRYLHRRCRDTELAQDLTHDVFMSAIRSHRPVAELSTGWLITAAQHALIDVARRHDRYRAKLRLLRGGLDEAVPANDPVDRIVLEAAMGRLSVDHRLVLGLHYLDGLTVAELAQRLGKTHKAVEGLITRARRNLHRELERTDA
jgi:RNA polymerase sigma-70 factor (ECF subfamily)